MSRHRNLKPPASILALIALASSPAAAQAGEAPSCARPTGQALSAPASTLLAGVLRGPAAKAEDGRGPRVQVIYFGAAWCGPCRLQVRAMKAAYEAGEPARLGYEVIFVSRDADPKAAAAYAEAERMPWAYLPPGAGGGAREVAALGGRSVPDMVVVDSRGRVLCRAYTPDGRYIGVSQVFGALRRSLGG